MVVTLKCIKEDERKLYASLLKRKEFDLEVVSDRLSKAKTCFICLQGDESSSRRLPNDKIVCLINALEEYAVKNIDFDKIEKEINTLHDSVKTIRDKKTLKREEKKAVKKLCEGLNHFRKTLVSVLGVPPMYLNRDKASALTAALVYQRINMTHKHPQPHEDNPHEHPQPHEDNPHEHPQPREDNPHGHPQPREDNPHEHPQPHEDNPRELGQRQLSTDHNERYSLLLSLIEEEF